MRLAYEAAGSGPPVVLVHGNMSDRRYFSRLGPLLAGRFTTVAVDRRGHGESGDEATYALAREAEDVAAACEEVGARRLVGHSFGASVALAAAPLLELDRLALYEPSPGWGLYDTSILDRFDALGAAGDREAIVEEFYAFFGGAAPRESPRWPSLVADALTVPREWRAEASFDALPRVGVPTLLLVGGESPEWARLGVERVAAACPAGRVVVLDGADHHAPRTAPDIVARELLSFLP